MMKREIKKLLEEGGWNENRFIDTHKYENKLIKKGFLFNDKALEFLSSFGNIYITYSDCINSSQWNKLDFNVLKASRSISSKDIQFYYEPRIEKHIYNIKIPYYYDPKTSLYFYHDETHFYKPFLKLRVSLIGEIEHGQMVLLMDKNSKVYLIDIIDEEIFFLVGNTGIEAIENICSYKGSKKFKKIPL